jgi:hypothetical protein
MFCAETTVADFGVPESKTTLCPGCGDTTLGVCYSPARRDREFILLAKQSQFLCEDCFTRFLLDNDHDVILGDPKWYKKNIRQRPQLAPMPLDDQIKAMTEEIEKMPVGQLWIKAESPTLSGEEIKQAIKNPNPDQAKENLKQPIDKLKAEVERRKPILEEMQRLAAIESPDEATLKRMEEIIAEHGGMLED